LVDDQKPAAPTKQADNQEALRKAAIQKKLKGMDRG
jgi:hypothetical protein